MDVSTLKAILERAARDAVAGTLPDTDRVALYRLALTVASEELYRISNVVEGVVAAEPLLLMQQISLICADEVDAEKLFGPHQAQEDADESEGRDSGS